MYRKSNMLIKIESLSRYCTSFSTERYDQILIYKVLFYD